MVLLAQNFQNDLETTLVSSFPFGATNSPSLVLRDRKSVGRGTHSVRTVNDTFQ
jgi:hypothetical protein